MRRFAIFGVLAFSSLGAQRPAARDSLSALADSIVSTAKTRDHLTRGAVVLVRASGVAAARGFGTTAAGDSVDPGRTAFRLASNSKLLVAVAALQLAERGVWRLSDDVNAQLPPELRLASGPGRPITIADLLTHTSGIEARFEGSVSPLARRVSLEQYFVEHVPVRIEPPGRDISYSNTGIALAGLLVERAAKTPFATYVHDQIFAPLGMDRSSLDQPPPADWSRDLAAGVPRGRYAIAFNAYPAASWVGTPLDAARFLRAHLARGRGTTGHWLDSSTVDDLLASHWRAQPDVPAVAYGWFEGMRNGHRYFFHTGDSGDHSLMLLMPDADVACFFVFSGSDEQSVVRERLADALLARAFGAQTPSPIATRTTTPIDAFAGSYRTAAVSASNYEKLKMLVARVRVRVTGAAIAIEPPGGGAAVQLRRVGDMTFRGDSGEVVAFQRDADGVIRRFTLTGSVWDPASWIRASWIEGTMPSLLLLVLWIGVAIGAAVALPRSYGRPWRRAARVGGSLAALAPVAGFIRAMTSFTHPSAAIPSGIHLAAGVAMLGAATMGVAGVARLAMRDGAAGTVRTWAGLLTSAGLAGLILLGYWRILPL